MARQDPYTTITTRRTPQSEQAAPEQVPNSAGGYTFHLDDEARLRRWLVLGSEGASYYASAQELTKENAGLVIRMVQTDAKVVVDTLLEVSLAGRAPKQNPTLFALAAAVSLAEHVSDRRYAVAAVPQIVRTGTHLAIFTTYAEQFRGWGRGMRRAVASWYDSKTADQLAYQMLKYRTRDGWTHRDLLRQAHYGQPLRRLNPEGKAAHREAHRAKLGPEKVALFDWLNDREVDWAALPSLVDAFTSAHTADATVSTWVNAVDRGVSWEMLPDAALGHKEVWEALVDAHLPQTALLRQLPRLTRLEVTRSRRDQIVRQLTDPATLKAARVHPINVLVAARTYASGHSARGAGQWTPDPRIVDALDAAFYASFGAVTPSGKRTLIALDVSTSMTAPISNMPLTAREASAALALVTASTEPHWDIVGFTGGQMRRMRSYEQDITDLTELSISPRQRLDDVLHYVDRLPFGGTDCALPLLWAQAHHRQYETVIILTDSETWAGAIHPHQALVQYRRHTGIPTRLIVVGMTSTGFSIADPNDEGSLDVVGMDGAVPQLIADFSRGL